MQCTFYMNKTKVMNNQQKSNPSSQTKKRGWRSILKKRRFNYTVAVALVVMSLYNYERISSSFVAYQSNYEANIKYISKNLVGFNGRQDTCSSPEDTVPWILDNSCMEEPIISVLNNTENQHSCGLCGQNALYMKTLQIGLEAKYKDKCRDLVVYGACLGPLCQKLMQKRNEWTFVERPGTCFFMFAGGLNKATLRSGTFTSNIMIIVHLNKMPYKSNRRNVKLLKFTPRLLFPWADRVIWQDAKLPSHWSFQLPKDYMLHFNRTVQHHGTCASFMGLPLSRSSVGNSENVTLNAQCDVVKSGFKDRPSISDSEYAIRTQCDGYVKKNIRQTPLVDTAFIVYDMRSPACRNFNGNFLCSWLDEIHCHGDRDQISFPFIMDIFHLKLAPELDIPGLEYRDQIYVNQNKNNTVIHIAKRSCHWYYSSFSRCVAHANESYELDNSKENHFATPSSKNRKDHISYILKQQNKRIRVAVIVAGTLQRFIFHSTFQHLFKTHKNKNKNIAMDYFVSLTTQKAKAYRSNNGYTNYFESDPNLPRSNFSDYIDIEEYIRTKVGGLRVSIGDVTLQDSIDIDSELLLKARRAEELSKYPNEDPDAKFPIFDVRSKEIEKRTANANRNLLRMHLSIQNLWNLALKWEKEENFKYDYVMFMRDDTLWLDHFDIRNLDDKDGDIYIPSCNARDPPMAPSELNDHILISKRQVSDLFGNYYKTLHSINVTKCMEQLPDALTKKDNQGYKRGCNSEMLLKYVIEENNINVTKVPQSEIPFQRSANVNIPGKPHIQCFHKFCQSQESPLNTTNMKKCADIDWELPSNLSEK